MKVFLSWSGDASHSVACVLKDWLPSVIQSLRPYVSSQDIDKGARWSTDIAKELQESTFGILCITKSNIDAPWINFEAGALSKTVDRALVAPFLFDIKRSEVQGPLLQFQSTINDREDLLKLLLSINSAMPEAERLEELSLNKSFSVWWPELSKGLGDIKTTDERPKGHDRTAKNAQTEAILEEILELTRNQQRLLRSPEDLFPPAYLEHVLRRLQRHPRQIGDLMNALSRMQSIAAKSIATVDRLGIEEDAAVRDLFRTSMMDITAMVTEMEYLLLRGEERNLALRPASKVRSSSEVLRERVLAAQRTNTSS